MYMIIMDHFTKFISNDVFLSYIEYLKLHKV